jgi:hypothetical protein
MGFERLEKFMVNCLSASSFLGNQLAEKNHALVLRMMQRMSFAIIFNFAEPNHRIRRSDGKSYGFPGGFFPGFVVDDYAMMSRTSFPELQPIGFFFCAESGDFISISGIGGKFTGF